MCKLMLRLALLTTVWSLPTAYAGQESGGGVVFTYKGKTYLFGAAERTDEFIPGDHPQTRGAYLNVIQPQLRKLAKVAPGLAQFIRVRLEGEKGPRWYFTHFKLRSTNDVGQTDIRIDDPSVALLQLARNNGNEIKIFNFDDPMGGGNGWATLSDESYRAEFIIYELLEAEIRKFLKGELKLLVTGEDYRKLTALILSKNLELRYGVDPKEFRREFRDDLNNFAYLPRVLDELTTYLFDSEPVAKVSDWEDKSMARNPDGTQRLSHCWKEQDECVLRDILSGKGRLMHTNYWSEPMVDPSATPAAATLSYADVLQKLAQVNVAKFGGYSDWRVPGILELEEAMANGLNSLRYQYPAFVNQIPAGTPLLFWSGDQHEDDDGSTQLIYDFRLKKRYRATDPAQTYAWIFVRSDLDAKWDILATANDHTTVKLCTSRSDDCFVHLKHANAFVTKVSPTGNLITSGALSEACSDLNKLHWGGRSNWQVLDRAWADSLAHHGVYRVFLRDEKLGSLSRVWLDETTTDTLPYTPYTSRTYQYIRDFSVGRESGALAHTSSSYAMRYFVPQFNPWVCVARDVKK